MKLSKEQRNSLELSTALAEKHLDDAAEYLSGRGISEESAHSFRLGVVGDDALPGDERFIGRLSIPYLTRAGVVDIRYRCLEAHDCHEYGHPKYLGRPGSSLRIFNASLGLFDPRDYLCVCEGELDTIVLQQAGLPAVGLPGASSWKPHFARVLEDYSRVYLFADGDDAGRKLARVVAENVPTTVVLEMPPGKDVNDCMLEFGRQWLREKVGE